MSAIEDQRAIQSLIDQGDRALSQWDIHGMFAHATPDYADITSVSEKWLKGQRWSDITSTSEIIGFVLTDDKASVKYTSHYWTRFKSPRWLSKILIITDELYGSEWVKTSDGWLCKSSEHLKMQFRRIKWQNPGEHSVSEPGQPAT